MTFPSPRRNRGVVIAIVVVAALLLAAGAVYLLTRDDEPAAGAEQETSSTSEPTGAGDAAGLGAAAKKYVDAVNGADETAAKDVMCDGSTPGILYEENAGKGDVLAGEAELISDTAGVVAISLADSNAQSVPLAFEYTDGAWCVQF